MNSFYYLLTILLVITAKNSLLNPIEAANKAAADVVAKAAAAALAVQGAAQSPVSNFIDEVKLYATTTGAFCWKDSYGRGVGTIPTTCGSKQYDAGLCYDYCRSGYTGVGPVCWEVCSGGFSDIGAICSKSVFNWHFKGSYGRGVGTIPNSCGSNQDYDAGLCYKKCAAGYTGVGPVCWKSCSGNASTDCGAACASSSAACANKIFQQVSSVMSFVQNVAAIVATGGGSAAIKATVEMTLKTAFKSALKAVAQGLSKQDFLAVMNAGAGKIGEVLAQATIGQLYDRAASGAEFSLSDFAAFDPTGIANVIIAFDNEVC